MASRSQNPRQSLTKYLVLWFLNYTPSSSLKVGFIYSQSLQNPWFSLALPCLPPLPCSSSHPSLLLLREQQQSTVRSDFNRENEKGKTYRRDGRMTSLVARAEEIVHSS